MESKEKWNLIVEQYSQYFNKPEALIQHLWESYCVELLDYKKLYGEVDSQRSIQIGSSERVIPDIILRINNEDIFDIELKQYSLPFNNQFEQQLVSYLNQTHISVGMIVCQNIHLYVYDYSNKKLNKVTVSFIKDNPDGIKLVDLISKENFSVGKIKEFIETKVKSRENVKEIREQIDQELIKKLLIDHFSINYSNDEINKALEAFYFDISKKYVSDSSGNTKIPVLKSPVNANCNLNGLDTYTIGTYAMDWCYQKEKEGIIIFNPENTNGKRNIVRFTTKELERLIPGEDNPGDSSHCWKYRYCFYEIDLRNNNERMWISLKNRRDKINAVYDEIFKYSNYYKTNPNWEYAEPFKTSLISQSELKSKEQIFDLLDRQFEQLKSWENGLFEYLNGRR